MGHIGNRPEWLDSKYEPQSSDPSNPSDGLIFYSDGTSRAQGLWQYKGGDWAAIGGGGAELPSQLGFFDAEDEDLTGFSNIAISAVSPMSDLFTYDVSAYPASFPIVNTAPRNLEKIVAVKLHAVLTSGTAKFLLKDQSANIIDEIEFADTTIKEVTFSGYVPSSVTSLQLFIEDVSSATGLRLDDVEITDDPFVNKNLIHTEQSFFVATDNFWNATGDQEDFDHTLMPNNDNDIYEIVTETGVTKVRAKKKALFHYSLIAQTVANSNLIVERNGVEINRAAELGAGSPLDGVAGSIELDAQDFINFRVTNVHPNRKGGLLVTAQADTENVVHHSSGTENVFSARIANNGTASITSESSPFILSVVRNSTGNLTVNFKPGFFSVAPSVNVEIEGIGVSGLSGRGTPNDETSSQVDTFNSAGTRVDEDFTVWVQRQGSDYKNPNAYAVTSSEQIAILKDVKIGLNAGAYPTAQVWQTRELNTVEGDAAIVSLSANQFTLPAGEYFIEASAPSFTVNGHYIKLIDVDNTIDFAFGTADWTETAENSSGLSTLYSKFTITTSTKFEIQHFAKDANGDSNAMGQGVGVAGVINVYAQVVIRKIR